MLSGEVDSVQGYAVTRIDTSDDYARIDYCIRGWYESLQRMLPDFDFGHMVRVEKMLANGIMLTHEDVTDVLKMMNRVEDMMIKIPAAKIQDAVTAQLISIELEQQGIIKDREWV